MSFLLTVWRTINWRVWLIVGVAITLIILLAGWRCEANRAREARHGQRQAEARTESAVSAIKEISALEARGDATQAEVEQAHEAIRQADPADRDRIARLQLCRLHDRADCDRLFGPG